MVQEVLIPAQYIASNIDDSVGRTHTRQIGQIVFDNSNANNKTISIFYKKDINLLSAADRINLFIIPTTGMLANDLGQILDGIDYGGQVKLRVLNLQEVPGWSADKWFISLLMTLMIIRMKMKCLQ